MILWGPANPVNDKEAPTEKLYRGHCSHCGFIWPPMPKQNFCPICKANELTRFADGRFVADIQEAPASFEGLSARRLWLTLVLIARRLDLAVNRGIRPINVSGAWRVAGNLIELKRERLVRFRSLLTAGDPAGGRA